MPLTAFWALAPFQFGWWRRRIYDAPKTLANILENAFHESFYSHSLTSFQSWLAEQIQSVLASFTARAKKVGKGREVL
jgi:hypothetical protein